MAETTIFMKSGHVHVGNIPIVMRKTFLLGSTPVSNETIAPRPGKGSKVTANICPLMLPALSHLFLCSVVGAFAIRRIVQLFRIIGYAFAFAGGG
jgi:hypothetical protein